MAWMIDSVREAPVAAEAVFALYADPGTWPAWGHNATWAHADGPLVQGGTVDVRANYRTVYRCRIRRLEPGRVLELVVRPAGLSIVNVYEVSPTESGSRIRHAFEVSGPLAGITRALGLPRMYRRQLDEEVDAVIRLASAGPGARPPGSRRTTVSRPERVWHSLGRLARGGHEHQRG